MSDCIKPRAKVFIFGSLEEMAGGGVRTPRLDCCVPYRSSLSYITRLVARLAEFCRVYSDIIPKFSGKQENMRMQHRRPRCHSSIVILLR